MRLFKYIIIKVRNKAANFLTVTLEYNIGVFADLISDVIFTNLHDNKQILGWQ